VSKIKIDIREILQISERRRQINRLNLEDIEFYDGDKKLDIDKKIVEEFEFIGLNNVDFITTDYYLRKES
jgi:predicted ATP-grasp superfamily ATP-dependent carboligase